MNHQDNEDAASIRITMAGVMARELGFTQLIVFGHSEETGTVITTWGDTAERSAQAAAGANIIKRQWRWPEDTIVESAKVTALREELAEANRRLAALELKEVTIHFIKGTEYECGWGSRPDGFVAFLSKQEAEEWMANYNAKHNNKSTTPDTYTLYTYVGLLKAGPDTARRLTISKYVHAVQLWEFST